MQSNKPLFFSIIGLAIVIVALMAVARQFLSDSLDIPAGARGVDKASVAAKAFPAPPSPAIVMAAVVDNLRKSLRLFFVIALPSSSCCELAAVPRGFPRFAEQLRDATLSSVLPGSILRCGQGATQTKVTPRSHSRSNALQYHPRDK